MSARFTLVELMIVVAIVAILAAIAVPNFVAMQLRSKRAELAPNSSGIWDAQIAYAAAYDTILTVNYKPVLTSALGKTANPWVTGSNFDQLGWRPDGQVRGTYCAVTAGSMAICGAVSSSLWQGGAESFIDVDNDDVIASYSCCTSPSGCAYYTNNSVY